MTEQTKAEKVSHVLNAKQTRDHTCHWTGCTVKCKPAMWGCKKHWFMLPLSIRQEIWLTYSAGQEETLTPSAEYLAAAKKAQEWIAVHYPRTR